MLQGVVPEQESCHGWVSRFGSHHCDGHGDCQVHAVAGSTRAPHLQSPPMLMCIVRLCLSAKLDVSVQFLMNDCFAFAACGMPVYDPSSLHHRVVTHIT